MFLKMPARILLGLVGCLVLLPQQVYASCIPWNEAHSHGHGHRHQSHSPAPTLALSGSVPLVTTQDTIVSTTSSVTSIPIATSSATFSASVVLESNTASVQANVIVPFYAYPTAGAWTPLENLVATNPNVKFTIIINPDTGPGSSPLPDENFLTAVPQLAAHSNVLTIGYVHTQKGSRAISDVEQDIKTYAGWPSASGNQAFAVHGIFLDEAPNEYNADNVAYYQQLASLVKGGAGLGPENYVVMNPGTVPNSSYLSIPDCTVVFESTYSDFQEALSSNMFDSLQGINRNSLSTMIYSIPGSVDLSSLVSTVANISSQNYLANADNYQTFDTLLTTVTPLLASVDDLLGGILR